MAGPRIVEYAERTPAPDASSARLPRAILPEGGIVRSGFSAGEARLGVGVATLADAVVHRQNEEAKAWAASALSQARLDWTQQLLDRQATAGPNAPDFTPNLLNDFNAYANKAVENAPSQNAKVFLAQQLQEYRTTLGQHAMQFESNAKIDWREDQYRLGVDNTAKLMQKDPTQFKSALAEQLAIIDSANLPPLKQSALRERAITRISEAATWTEIQRSPSAWLASIGFGGDTVGGDGKTRKSSGDLAQATGNAAFDILPFDNRVKLFDSAIRLKAQIDNDANIATAKKAKALGDDAMKEGWSRFYSGKLNRDYIEQIRPLVSDNDYRSLLEANRKGLNEGGQKTDPGTFAELMRLQAAGKYDEAQAFAFRSYRAGLLSTEHFSAEINRVRTDKRQEGPRSEYERSRAYITNALAPSPMIPDPVGKHRFAEAMDTFDRWRLANPNAPDVDVDKRAKEVVNQYKFINMQETVVALPMPRSGAIRRQVADPKGMNEDIVKATQNAKKRFDNKDFNQAEYDNEMALLNRWRKLVPVVPTTPEKGAAK